MIWELKLFWSFWGLKWITMFHMHPDSYLNIGPRNKLKPQKSGKDSQDLKSIINRTPYY